MLNGEGIETAVREVDVVIHCASSPFKDAMAVEREGTARLLAAARQSGVAHVVYVSIVGIDRILAASVRGPLHLVPSGWCRRGSPLTNEKP